MWCMCYDDVDDDGEDDDCEDDDDEDDEDDNRFGGRCHIDQDMALRPWKKSPGSF